MPLKKGKSKKTISKNIETEMKKYKKTGKIGTSKPKTKKKAQKQATAIALSKARESGAKIPKKKKTTLKESFDNYINSLVKKSFCLVKESKKEVETEVKNYIKDDRSLSNTINKKERIKITNAMHKSTILGGTTKVDSISKGLWEVGNVLDSCGYVLDMVTGDMINAPQGNILIPFMRKGENPYVEGVEIENSRISFTWENLEKLEDGIETKKRYEIIAYLT
jgi:hypothetical protein